MTKMVIVDGAGARRDVAGYPRSHVVTLVHDGTRFVEQDTPPALASGTTMSLAGVEVAVQIPVLSLGTYEYGANFAGNSVTELRNYEDGGGYVGARYASGDGPLSDIVMYAGTEVQWALHIEWMRDGDAWVAVSSVARAMLDTAQHYALEIETRTDYNPAAAPTLPRREMTEGWEFAQLLVRLGEEALLPRPLLAQQGPSCDDFNTTILVGQMREPCWNYAMNRVVGLAGPIVTGTISAAVGLGYGKFISGIMATRPASLMAIVEAMGLAWRYPTSAAAVAGLADAALISAVAAFIVGGTVYSWGLINCPRAMATACRVGGPTGGGGGPIGGGGATMGDACSLSCDPASLRDKMASFWGLAHQ